MRQCENCHSPVSNEWNTLCDCCQQHMDDMEEEAQREEGYCVACGLQTDILYGGYCVMCSELEI